MKFNKRKWNEADDPGFPPPARNRMLADLLHNYKLKGLKYNELIDLLGQPNAHDSTSINYDIVIRYAGIDPNYVKSLTFDLSKDSVITAYHVEEWKE